MTRLVVISNRVSVPEPGKPQAGGLAVAITGALEECGGMWFGWDGKISQTPSNHPATVQHGNITYATLPLSREDYEDYYLGFSNEVVWPVFHFNLQEQVMEIISLLKLLYLMIHLLILDGLKLLGQIIIRLSI